MSKAAVRYNYCLENQLTSYTTSDVKTQTAYKFQVCIALIGANLSSKVCEFIGMRPSTTCGVQNATDSMNNMPVTELILNTYKPFI